MNRWLDVTLWLDWPGHLMVESLPLPRCRQALVSGTLLWVTCTPGSGFADADVATDTGGEPLDDTATPFQAAITAGSLRPLAERAARELSDWMTVVGRAEAVVLPPAVLWLHVWRRTVIKQLVASPTPWHIWHWAGQLCQVRAQPTNNDHGAPVSTVTWEDACAAPLGGRRPVRCPWHPTLSGPAGMPDRPRATHPTAAQSAATRSTATRSGGTSCRGETVRAGRRVTCRHPMPNARA